MKRKKEMTRRKEKKVIQRKALSHIKKRKGSYLFLFYLFFIICKPSKPGSCAGRKAASSPRRLRSSHKPLMEERQGTLSAPVQSTESNALVPSPSFHFSFIIFFSQSFLPTLAPSMTHPAHLLSEKAAKLFFFLFLSP
jgi:hypothetical protein